MAGIPARYCQGYVMTMGNFTDAIYRNADAAEPLASYALDIADDQAHAWVEIYADGYGWIPYEFTESVQEMWHTASYNTAQTTAPSVTSSTSVTTTTATTVSYVTNSGNSTGNGTENPGGSGDWKALLHTLLVLLLIAGAAAAFVGWRRLDLNRRSRAMHADNPNESAEASYTFLCMLLGILGIRQNGRSHDAFAVAAESACELLDKGCIADVIRTMQTVAFSREGISAEEAAAVRETAETLAEEIYRQAKTPRRFWLKWFRHIV